MVNKSRCPASKWERGYAMSYWTIVLATVVVPLMSLVVDLNRAMYIRTHLQAAADAGCEAAAAALNVSGFNSSGSKSIQESRARTLASSAFNNSVTDQGIVEYSPGLKITFSATQASCTATASVTPLISVTPDLTVKVISTSELRVNTN